MGIASRRRPRRMARSDSGGHAPGSLTSKVRIEPTSHRAGGRRSDDREEGQRLASPSRASWGRRCETKIGAAMEMTRSWKSQNDFHKRLEISLTNARFPHSHSRSSSFQTRKKTEQFNHASHTKILTPPFEMPRHRRARNYFEDPFLQFTRKLPRDNIFVMFDGCHDMRERHTPCQCTLPESLASHLQPQPQRHPNLKLQKLYNPT
jgi:hypothetical protein